MSIIEKFLNNFNDLNVEWLITGEGEMLKNNAKVALMTPEETAEFDKKVEAGEFQVTTSDGKTIKTTAPKSNNEVKRTNNFKEGIPLIPIDAVAGFGSGESSVFEYECERFVIPVFRDAEFLISVRGSSMQPKYNSGDIVACKRLPISTFFQWNKVYVLDTKQGALIKRIKQGSDNDHLLIISDNPTYPPFELHKSEIHALAIVIGVVRLE